MLKSYKELKVWQKAYQLCLQIYKVTKGFPKEELFGITSQIRRSSLSIPCNVAEGYGRRSRLEYIRFLNIAYGSLCELETQVLLSGDLNYFKERELKEVQTAVGEVERMLMALIKSLGKTNKSLESLRQ